MASLLASIVLHAIVLATAALLIGEIGTGPAESSSTLHVTVEHIEPTDKSPKENPAPDFSEQVTEQHKYAKSKKPKQIIKQTKQVSKTLRVAIAPTKAQPQQQPEAIQAVSKNSRSKPSSNKKGAEDKDIKPIQLAKVGNYSRLSRDYQSKLQRLVERYKYYPLQARRNGIQGRAAVSFTVINNGKIKNILLSRSSGNPLLDQAAIRTIKRIGRAPPFPNTIKRTKWRFNMPIVYDLRK